MDIMETNYYEHRTIRRWEATNLPLSLFKSCQAEQFLGASAYQSLNIPYQQSVEITGLRMTRDIIAVWDSTSGAKCLAFIDWGVSVMPYGTLDVFSDTKDTGVKINIYKENNKFYIQNMRQTASITILRI